MKLVSTIAYFPLLLIPFCLPAHAQSVGGTVANWDGGEAELFGDFDRPPPPVLGSIAPNGALEFKLPSPGKKRLSIHEALPCSEGVEVTGGDQKMLALSGAMGVKALGAFDFDTIKGNVRPGSSPEIAAWYANPVNNPAVTGRYLDYWHVENAASVRGNCTDDQSQLSRPNRDMNFELVLQPGWNAVVREVTRISDSGTTPASLSITVTAVAPQDLDIPWHFKSR